MTGRAHTLQAAGGFPDAPAGAALLGQRLAQAGWRARHLPEALLTCEVPEEGAAFRAAARRCRGCLQARGGRPLLGSVRFLSSRRRARRGRAIRARLRG